MKKFGHNEDGRGHWDEVEFMISLLLRYFSTKQNKNETNCKRSIVAQLMNSNSNLELFPVYVLQYVRRGKNVLLEKKFSCGDDGVFPNPNPCVLILKDNHFYNMWNYNSLFNEIDCPTLQGRKHNKGSNER